MELSLTPDRVRGLPVWSQDIRWSLLGYALEPTRAAGKESAAVSDYCYLEWMELKLLVRESCQRIMSPCVFWGNRGGVNGDKTLHSCNKLSDPESVFVWERDKTLEGRVHLTRAQQFNACFQPCLL